VQVAKLEAEGVTGEAAAAREQEIAVAQQTALSEQGKKAAEAERRKKVAELEADAVKGENESRALIVHSAATLEERKAEAKRRAEVAAALAARDVLLAEKEQELARLEKTELVQQTIEQRKVEIDAEAEAERIRRIARGEADAILAKYSAEAEGLLKVLDAKAAGYEKLLAVCGDRKDLAPALLIIEKLPELVAEQVKAIQNLKIDKITVWDSGANGHGDAAGGSTKNFLRGLIGALPPIHELAEQAGIDLPEVLGKVQTDPRAARDMSATAPRTPELT
jgi:flotillin